MLLLCLGRLRGHGAGEWVGGNLTGLLRNVI